MVRAHLSFQHLYRRPLDYANRITKQTMGKSLAEYPIWIYILFMRNCKTIVTTAKWGNSIGVRIPSNIANSTGINIGDKIEISNTADGKIIIEKKTKDISELKGFGGLHKYANPSLIPLEKKAFGIMMEEKYGKKIYTTKELIEGIRKGIRGKEKNRDDEEE